MQEVVFVYAMTLIVVVVFLSAVRGHEGGELIDV